MTTSTYSKVLLINGAQAKNVYWEIEGAASINNYSVFCGTIICNNGALSAINTGVILNGRALTTSGALTSTAITSTMEPECTPTALESNPLALDAVTIVPNPIGSSTTIVMNVEGSYSLRIYNSLGQEVMNTRLTQQSTSLDTRAFHNGIYFYKVTSGDNLIQSGKLISNQ